MYSFKKVPKIPLKPIPSPPGDGVTAIQGRRDSAVEQPCVDMAEEEECLDDRVNLDSREDRLEVADAVVKLLRLLSLPLEEKRKITRETRLALDYLMPDADATKDKSTVVTALLRSINDPKKIHLDSEILETVKLIQAVLES